MEAKREQLEGEEPHVVFPVLQTMMNRTLTSAGSSSSESNGLLCRCRQRRNDIRRLIGRIDNKRRYRCSGRGIRSVGWSDDCRRVRRTMRAGTGRVRGKRSGQGVPSRGEKLPGIGRRRDGRGRHGLLLRLRLLILLLIGIQWRIEGRRS